MVCRSRQQIFDHHDFESGMPDRAICVCLLQTPRLRLLSFPVDLNSPATCGKLISLSNETVLAERPADRMTITRCQAREPGFKFSRLKGLIITLYYYRPIIVSMILNDE